MSSCGPVYLVGAGPGDPDLLTVKAARILGRAEVVVYDRLVGPGIVGIAPDSCKKVYAGKRKHMHAMSQREINTCLVNHARKGRRVVRLKGGDPFIFGRGGEEKIALTEAGIRCEIVPGITAASGASAYAGLPLTHRNQAQAVTFVTAHRVAGSLQAGSLQIDWRLVTNANQSVVFYMASSVAVELAQALLDHGCNPERRFSVISNATLPHQSEVHTTLGEFVELSIAVPAPAILMLHDMPEIFTRDPEVGLQTCLSNTGSRL